MSVPWSTRRHDSGAARPRPCPQPGLPRAGPTAPARPVHVRGAVADRGLDQGDRRRPDERGHERADRLQSSSGVPTCCSRLSRSTATRWPIVIASTWSWVTATVVILLGRCRPAICDRVPTRSLASRLDSGSSMQNTLGFPARSPGPSRRAVAARPRGHRACGRGTVRARGSEPPRRPGLSTSDDATFAVRQANAMFCAAVMFGYSA